jgi:hypothetical protein
MEPAVVNYALNEFERQLATSFSEKSNQIGRMRKRSDLIQQELRNLVSTVASCGPSSALVDAINQREQELNEIGQKLVAGEGGSVSGQVARIRQFVTENLGDIRQLLCANVQRARAELAKHVTAVHMQPQFDGKKGHYVATGNWNLIGELIAGKNEVAEMRVRMVAGACFEAIHNALAARLIRRWALPKNGRRPNRN